jgi:hypothetical protein
VRKNARILSRFLSQFVCATARLFFPNFQSSRRLSLSLSLSLSTSAKYPTTCSLPLLSLFPSRRGFSFSLARSIFSDVEMCAPHRARVKGIKTASSITSCVFSRHFRRDERGTLSRRI